MMCAYVGQYIIKMSGFSCTAIKTAKQRVMEDQCSPTASLQTSVVDAQDSDSERSKRTPVLENFMPLKRRWEKVTKSEIDGQEGDGPDSEFQQKVVLGRPAWMGEAQLWTKHSQGIGHEVSSLILGHPFTLFSQTFFTAG